MPIESPVNGISDLNQTWPIPGDPRAEGDDHLNLVKRAILLTFPNIIQVINATDADLNILAGVILSGLTQTELLYLNGVIGPIQAQIDDPNIARLNQANVFTQIQTIIGTGNVFDLDTGGPSNDNTLRFLHNGSPNGSLALQNVNSAATGYTILQRLDGVSALASYLQLLEDGNTILANNVNGSKVNIQANGTIILDPVAGQLATYRTNEIATLVDIAGLRQTETVMGTITAGGTITPPSGYTPAQTDFMVSMADTSTATGGGSTISNFQCAVTSVGVTSANITWTSGTSIAPATLNYIAVGTK